MGDVIHWDGYENIRFGGGLFLGHKHNIHKEKESIIREVNCCLFSSLLSGV